MKSAFNSFSKSNQNLDRTQHNEKIEKNLSHLRLNTSFHSNYFQFITSRDKDGPVMTIKYTCNDKLDYLMTFKQGSLEIGEISTFEQNENHYMDKKSSYQLLYLFQNCFTITVSSDFQMIIALFQDSSKVCIQVKNNKIQLTFC